MEDRESQIQAVVRRFFTLQEERSLTYSVFNEAHKIYLASPDEKAFRKFEKIVGDLTQDFKRISLDIIKIEKDLKEKFNESVLSALIREIQNYEKTKLTLTAQLQIKKKEQKDLPCDETIDDTIANLNQSLNETVDGINKVLETIRFEIDA